jgi:hypothetical protein
MATESTLKKNISEFSGVDYRSHDAKRSDRFARYANNVEFLKNGSISNRKGTHGRSYSTIPVSAIQNYVRLRTDGTTEEELVVLGESLYRVVEGSILVDYVGGPATATSYIEIVPVDNGNESYTVRCRTYDGTNPTPLELDMDLGTGINEAAFVTITDLVAAIQATGGHNCTLVSGDGTQPAAFLEYMPPTNTNPDLTLSFWYLEEVPCPTAAPFQTWINNIDLLEDFENASLLNHSNNLYIATGEGKLYKYDGVATYAAGMPAATTLAAAVGSATGLTGDYSWMITYEQDDANGNITEGDGSNIVELTLANEKGAITIPTIQSSSEYLTSYAVANNGGTQTGTTLTVDDGSGGNHTLEIGMTAYFYDNAGAEQAREITAIAATTITIAGAAVTIANNAVISANLRINLWRNAAGGSAFYLVRSFANDPTAVSISYSDAVADIDLGAEYEEPDAGHGPPPEDLKYLTAYNNILIGATGRDDVVHYADYDGPEYFPIDFSSLTIKSKSNRRISALGANRELLLVQKGDESHVIIGDLPEAKYRQEILADDIGNDANASLVDIDGTLWFMSGKYGVRRAIGMNLPDDMSYRILPELTKPGLDPADALKFNSCVGVVYPQQQMAIFYVPAMTVNGGYIYPNEQSVAYVADYRTQFEGEADYDEDGRVLNQFPKVKWWPWTGVNMMGGACVFNDQLVWLERRYSEVLGENEYFITTRLNGNNRYDYTEHAQPMNWEWENGWQHFNSPEQLKKFIGARIYSYPEVGTATADVEISVEEGFNNDRIVTKATIEFGDGVISMGFGEAFDTTGWGSPSDPRSRFQFKPFTSTAMKIRFKSRIFCEQAVISGWVTEVVPALLPKIKDE